MKALTLPLGPAPAADSGRGLVRIPPDAMAQLGLRPGDSVALEAARRTHARVLPQPVPGGRAGTDAVLAANAGAAWGARVTVQPAALPPLAAATLRLRGTDAAPAADVAEALRDMVLTVGDRVELATRGPARLSVEVTALDPAPAGHVVAATAVRIERDAPPERPYPGIGGLGSQIESVRELVELPLRHPALFRRLGIEPPRGILLVGPPGTGKTLLAREVAAASKARFLDIAAPEILSKHYGESEAALRRLFEQAERSAPAIVFIDEIDAIAPRRDALSGEKQVERRLVAQLLALMDGLRTRGEVIVMAATNLPDALDPALRRPGRFDREVVFTAPDAAARADILALHLAHAPLAPDADLRAVAARAHGFVGADLAALASEAAMAALARAIRAAGRAADVDPATLLVGARDLETALGRVRPSLLRDTEGAGAPVRWGDIGGLDDAKAALAEAVIWPATHPEAVARLGLERPRGVLLAGPPGTGKTLLVRALAAESGLNFIGLSPAQALSQFLGEAERAVADLFRRARTSAPCLVFLDELDALVPRRGRADAAIERVLAQLLIELDGLRGNRDVVVVGATNRPEAIDPALIRPGRFDIVIPVPPPDAAARADILAVHCRGRPLAAEVDLAAIAAGTEGRTGAELAAVVAGAARAALIRAVAGRAAPGTVCIAPEDFARAIAEEARARALRAGTTMEGEHP